MAVLKAKKRNALAKSSFALPGSRKYPIHDKKHAAAAKARSTQMVKRGKLSASTRDKIHAKANRVLYGPKGKKGKK